jgi:polyisoprenoid-binding protein YceI
MIHSAIVSMLVLFTFSQSPTLAREFVLDPQHSHLKALAHATGHDFEAIASTFQCQISFDDQTLVPVMATLSLTLEDLLTGNKKRDKEMKHWLASETFPTISFQFTQWTSGKPAMLQGILTIHGQPVSIEVPVHFTRKEDAILLEGTFPIDTTQFGLEIIKKMGFLKVNPIVNIVFHLEGSLAS